MDEPTSDTRTAGTLPIRLEFTYTPDDINEWAKAPTPGMPGRGWRVWRGTITWLVFIALAVVFYAWQRRMEPPRPSRAAPPRSANPASDVLLTLLPWLVVFVVVWFLVARQLRAGKLIWNNNRSLQLSHVLTVEDGGIELAEPTASTRWKWEAFTSWTETANLLLLRLQNSLTLAMPKRAATADELEVLRRTFNARIAPPVGGFPVLPPSGGGAAPHP